MSETEQSIDLTPGVVWTDAQLAVVRDLVAQAHRAKAAVTRAAALADEFDANINWREWGIGNRIRWALRDDAR